MASESTEILVEESEENLFKELKFEKHKAGSPLKASAKKLLINMYIKMKDDNPSRNDKEIYKDISLLTGIGHTTIRHVKQAALKGQGTALTTSGKKRPNARGKRKRIKKLTPFQISAYRRHIHAFFFRNERPTIKRLLQTFDADTSLPKRARTTIYNTLRDLGFVFTRWNRNCILIERDDIKVWRCRYLRDIRKFRLAGRTIYYLDETWVNFGRAESALVTNPQQELVEGYRQESKRPSGYEGCLIAAHIGTEDGFLDGGLLIFNSKKGKNEYRFPTEMDEPTFEKWFQGLLPRLKPNSVIVLDNARCHSALVEKLPARGWKKEEIQQWLRGKGVEFTSCLVVAELLKLAKGVRDKYHAYKVDLMANEYGHTVLRLPPYHSEFNPMEMIWTQIKSYLETNSKTFKQAEVELLLREGVQCISSENWKLCTQHVAKEEETFWEHDHLTDATVVPFGEEADPDEMSSRGESPDNSSYDGLSGFEDSLDEN